MFHITSDDIWVPQLFLNNSHHHYGMGDCYPTECLVKADGKIGCWFPCFQEALCDADYVSWPFDRHTCNVVFRSFITNEDLQFDAEKLSLTIVRNSNNEFKMMSADGRLNLANKSSVKFTMIIQRHSSVIKQQAILPIICTIILSLITLLIDPTTNIRIVVCALNLYLQFSLMDRLWWQ
jgi:hypothetical protein